MNASVNPLSDDYSPVYLKININPTTKMATLNSTSPLTQTLPSTNDGIYYLYLGRSTNTKYTCSLEAHHPIYYHNGTKLCELIKDEQLNGFEDKLSFVTDSDLEDVEEITAAALNDLNNRVSNLEDADTSPLQNSTKLVTSGGVYSAVSAKYTKPSAGIPKTDLAYGVIPTISTNIQTDKASNVKTASPKAVYEEVHPAIASTQPQGGFLPNVFYNLGELTGSVTFTLATPSDNTIVNHYYWTFETGSTAPTITWPNGITWFGGSAPEISANKYYEISVLNGIGAFMEV